MEIKIKEFEDSLIDELICLRKSFYSRDDLLLDQSYIRWLYEKNTSGKTKLAIATEEGKFIGMIALIPIPIMQSGKTIIGYFAAHVLVHPDHNGKNIFIKLIRHAVKFITNSNSILIGHPNQLAIPGWTRAKMEFLPSLNYYTTKPSFDFSYRNRPLQNISELKKILSSKVICNDTVQVNLSAEFIEWRYIDCPNNTYKVNVVEYRGKIIGIIVYKVIKQFIKVIMDYVELTENAIIHSSIIPSIVAVKNKPSVLSFNLNKSLPYFVTNYSDLIINPTTSNINLSATDL